LVAGVPGPRRQPEFAPEVTRRSNDTAVQKQLSLRLAFEASQDLRAGGSREAPGTTDLAGTRLDCAVTRRVNLSAAPCDPNKMRVIGGVPPVDCQLPRELANLLYCVLVTPGDGVGVGWNDTDGVVDVRPTRTAGSQHVTRFRGCSRARHQRSRRCILPCDCDAGSRTSILSFPQSSSSCHLHRRSSKTEASRRLRLVRLQEAVRYRQASTEDPARAPVLQYDVWHFSLKC
jgi:hypothetical protein